MGSPPRGAGEYVIELVVHYSPAALTGERLLTYRCRAGFRHARAATDIAALLSLDANGRS